MGDKASGLNINAQGLLKREHASCFKTLVGGPIRTRNLPLCSQAPYQLS